MSVLTDELNDYLESVKSTLENLVIQMIKEKYQELYSEHQQLMVENQRLKDKLQEHQIIWEK